MRGDFYLAALSGPPTTMEGQKILVYLSTAKDRRATLKDVAWAIVNNKEFLLRG